MNNVYLIGGILTFLSIEVIGILFYMNKKRKEELKKSNRPLKTLDFEKDIEHVHTMISHEYNRELTLYRKSKIGDSGYMGMDEEDFNDNLITISRNVQNKLSDKYYKRMSNYISEEALREYITEKILLLLLKETEQFTQDIL